MLKRIWKRNWIVLTAIVVHGTWGVVLLFSQAPLHTTPLGALHAITILDDQYVSAAIYLVASAIAVVPVICQRLDKTLFGLLACGPQQFLLMVSFLTAVAAICRGEYPDGYVPDKYGSPRLFIFVDQLWPMVGMVCHTLSLVDWYWWSRFSSKAGK